MKLIKGILTFLALSLAINSNSFAHKYKFENLEIIKPHLRETPPGATVAAGYLIINNFGVSDDVLISAHSSISQKTEIHEMKIENDIMKMRKVKDGLEIKSGATLQLRSGGHHLMFIELKTPIIEGDTHEITLYFRKSGALNIPFKVWEPIGSKKAHPEHHH